MTVCLAMLVGDEGAVLAHDGRFTWGSNIITDSSDKHAVSRNVVSVVAGNDGSLLEAISKAGSLPALRQTAVAYSAGLDLDWALLSYDRRLHKLCILDQNDVSADVGKFYAIGCGKAFASGFVAAHQHPSTLEAAARLAAGAVKATALYDTAVGGDTTVIVAPRRGQIQVLVDRPGSNQPPSGPPSKKRRGRSSR